MSHTSVPSTQHHRHDRRRLTVRLAVTLLSVGCLVATAAGVAISDPDRVAAAADRWSGYSIPADGDADGGWIGGYRVGKTELYVTTPTRRPNRAGYRDPREVGDVAGRAGSAGETARAAWILSKYGGYRDRTQAAAVDASVYHLLVGGRWRIDAKRGARRIRQSGDPASVARFARIMLRQARARAGVYTARLGTSGADVGGTMAVTLTVLDGHGRPASGLPVSLAMSGAAPVDSVTGDDGRAVARFAADTRGWQEVTATVRNVPDHLLHVWPPARRGQAAAAEGGARRTIVVSTMSPVRGPQTLSLAADPGQLVVGSTARVVASVGGDGTPRTAVATLHGPFSSAAAASCVGAPVGSVSGSVAGDGSYALPPLTPPGGGYFAWRVAVDGTDTSLPVSGCGATVKVRNRTTLSLSAPASASVAEVVAAQVTLAGLPFGGPVDVTTTLYGPYATVAEACTGTHRVVTQRRPGNGTFPSLSFQVDEPGWYAWRASAPEGDLWLGSTSPCGVLGTMTQVTN